MLFRIKNFHFCKRIKFNDYSQNEKFPFIKELKIAILYRMVYCHSYQQNGILPLFSEWFFFHYFHNGFFPLFSEWFFAIHTSRMGFGYSFKNWIYPLFSEWDFSIIFRMVFFNYFQNGF